MVANAWVVLAEQTSSDLAKAERERARAWARVAADGQADRSRGSL